MLEVVWAEARPLADAAAGAEHADEARDLRPSSAARLEQPPQTREGVRDREVERGRQAELRHLQQLGAEREAPALPEEALEARVIEHVGRIPGAGRHDAHQSFEQQVGLLLFEMVAGAGPFDVLRDPNELFLAHIAKQAPIWPEALIVSSAARAVVRTSPSGSPSSSLAFAQPMWQ